MTTISSIIGTTPNPYKRIQKFVVEPQGNTVLQILENGKGYLQEGLTHGFNAAKMICGFLAVIGGAVAAAIFKENTAADWGSKILMILGAILGVAGVKDVIDHNKKTKEDILKPQYSFKIVNSGEQVKHSVNNLKVSDPNFFQECDPSKPDSESTIRKNEKNEEIRKKAIELLKKYTSPEITSMLQSYDGGTEDAFSNIEDRNVPASELQDRNVPASELQDRIALLLGYIYGSRSDTESDLNTVIPSVAEPDGISANYFKVLPHDFVKAYYSVKWFENHKDSIQPLIDSPANPVSLDDLNQVQTAQNQLNVLQDLILYVLDSKNFKSASSAKNVHVLRQALICGFGLKGNNIADFNEQLKGKFGDVRGQLEKVAKHITDAILPKINDGTLPFIRKVGRISDKVGDVLWGEFEGKPLEPASVS